MTHIIKNIDINNLRGKYIETNGDNDDKVDYFFKGRIICIHNNIFCVQRDDKNKNYGGGCNYENQQLWSIDRSNGIATIKIISQYIRSLKDSTSTDEIIKFNNQNICAE